MATIVYFKTLSLPQLRQLCKKYNMPLNGAKNKKDILHQIQIRIQSFKPSLPLEIYRLIILHAPYESIPIIRSTCRYFNNTINDQFWKEKSWMDFNIHDENYIKAGTACGYLYKGSERYLSYHECLQRAKDQKPYLISYFNKDFKKHINKAYYM